MRRYLDLLEGVFLVRQLQPWHANLKKQVKYPKIFFRDSGLLHQILGIQNESDLLMHPRLGASWEGYVLEEIIKALKPDASWFWETHAGAEIDLLLDKDNRRVGVEIKRMDAPRLTRSMKIALEDLNLNKILVVYPGEHRYALSDRVEVIPFPDLCVQGDSWFS